MSAGLGKGNGMDMRDNGKGFLSVAATDPREDEAADDAADDKGFVAVEASLIRQSRGLLDANSSKFLGALDDGFCG